MSDKTSHARELRKTSPDAERIIWSRIRGCKLDGFKFRRQHPVAGYFGVEARLVVELDGGQHAEAAEYDARRTAAIEAAGFRVFRFWNSAVFEDSDSVVETILRELRLGRA